MLLAASAVLLSGGCTTREKDARRPVPVPVQEDAWPLVKEAPAAVDGGRLLLPSGNSGRDAPKLLLLRSALSSRPVPVPEDVWAVEGGGLLLASRGSGRDALRLQLLRRALTK